MRARAEFAVALVADLVGAAGALLISARAWQSILAPRPRPLADVVVPVSGRTLEPAVFALGLVALAGVVAVLATRGIARRVVGAVLVVAGAGIVWPAVASFSAVSESRARLLVAAAHAGVGLDPAHVPQVTVHPAWPSLVVVCGLLVAASGLLVVARGQSWTGLSARYDAPTTGSRAARPESDARMWNALDRGADPTVEPTAEQPSDPPARTEP